MNNYSVYQAPRAGGKTTWILRQIDEALTRGETVAVVVPTQINRSPYVIYATQHDLPIDLYTESTFPRTRGRIYDQIFVDDANLFDDNPADFCARFHPGVPAAFTYTPSPYHKGA